MVSPDHGGGHWKPAIKSMWSMYGAFRYSIVYNLRQVRRVSGKGSWGNHILNATCHMNVSPIIAWTYTRQAWVLHDWSLKWIGHTTLVLCILWHNRHSLACTVIGIPLPLQLQYLYMVNNSGGMKTSGNSFWIATLMLQETPSDIIYSTTVVHDSNENRRCHTVFGVAPPYVSLPPLASTTVEDISRWAPAPCEHQWKAPSHSRDLRRKNSLTCRAWGWNERVSNEWIEFSI